MEAATAMAEGVLRAAPHAETVLLPVADGGDGTLDVLVSAPSPGDGTSGRYFQATVTGPLGEPRMASWGVTGHLRTAVIEMARASGLALVPPDHRDPRTATTHGTGELIRAALDAGYTDIIVGLGGSASNDGGAGMAQALGVRLLDAAGRELPHGGAALARLASIDLGSLDQRVRSARLRGATDVMNPLCGPEGASHVYGPQKGATAEMVAELDDALHHYADVARRELGIDVVNMPGAGAAGGTGAGLAALLKGELLPGADIVCDAVGLNHRLANADLVLTGEGRMDSQTLNNKAPFVVAQRAKGFGVPVIAVVGSLGPGYESVLEHGIEAVEAAATRDMPPKEAIAEADKLVREAAERAMRGYLAWQQG